MLFLNTSRIMPMIVGLLPLLLATAPIVNATPIVSKAVDIKALDGTIEARDGTLARRGDLCHHADDGYCTIAVTVTRARLDVGITDDMVYLFDNSCRQIGGMYSDQNINMASQLPYKIIGHMAFENKRLTAFPDFFYAGRCTTAYNGCWIHSDIGDLQWVNRCQFPCN
ncbi:hypothetical protein BOTCAL_0070g00090 [Botryotinia calthae]|uniref:Ecp2 effector protein domain-containing protein n=1 Tax=Botryotinia calthae TaxID=38488 RepID=A0A4Y8D8Y0_9HELO|nr:hypothetical protein BOTCAL_0070g00090 [Botryotinia calthae]